MAIRNAAIKALTTDLSCEVGIAPYFYAIDTDVHF